MNSARVIQSDIGLINVDAQVAEFKRLRDAAQTAREREFWVVRIQKANRRAKAN